MRTGGDEAAVAGHDERVVALHDGEFADLRDIELGEVHGNVTRASGCGHVGLGGEETEGWNEPEQKPC